MERQDQFDDADLELRIHKKWNNKKKKCAINLCHEIQEVPAFKV